MNDLRCRKHDIQLVPDGRGDWHCEKAGGEEDGCDTVTLIDILNMLGSNSNVSSVRV